MTPIGLCEDCANAKIVRSDRDSVFYQCRLAATDSEFPKYPRLPVLTCSGYRQPYNPACEMNLLLR